MTHPRRWALASCAVAGLLAAAQDYELGGMQLPTTVDKACFAYVLAANVGSARTMISANAAYFMPTLRG